MQSPVSSLERPEAGAAAQGDASDQLVSAAYAARAKVTAAELALGGLKAEFDAAAARVKALGAGRYAGALGGEAITVVVVDDAPDSMGPDTFELPAAAEAMARELAGDKFKSLFDRVVTHRPCSGFGDVLPRLLKGAKAAALRALCLVPGKAIKGRAGYTQLRYS